MSGIASRIAYRVSWNWQVARWRRGQEALSSDISRHVEFTGVRPPFPLLELGRGVRVERDVTIWLSNDQGSEPRLIAGDRVFIGRNTYLGAYQPIAIGRFSIIGAYSYLISANHRYDRTDCPIQDQGFSGAPVTIGEDVWIGTHVVVLPGVSIGDGAIIAAGSIVNRSVPAGEIWGGAPARFIRRRSSKSELDTTS